MFAPADSDGPAAWLVFLLIHVAVPLAGLAAYSRLVERMRAEDVPDPPLARLFAVFFVYGGWLVVALTGLFWMWSGMASLGAFFLVLVAPPVMLAIAVSLRHARRTSRYHRAAFATSAAYVPLLAVVIAVVALAV